MIYARVKEIVSIVLGCSLQATMNGLLRLFAVFITLSECLGCRSGWLNHGTSCYHLSHDKEAWINAEALCERFCGYLAEINDVIKDKFLQGWSSTGLAGLTLKTRALCERFGSYFAEINDVTEDTFLQGWVNNINKQFWIGGTDLENEGEWLWVHSRTMMSSSFTNWRLGEPNNGGDSDENCADARPFFGWNDERCWITLKYICEMTESVIEFDLVVYNLNFVTKLFIQPY
ncbi:C-type lectin lectoxin-Phi2-like isoform X2 [Dreissena polymorpha]|uniref:C-type lectin lectoxin-Phi2-like isoform X2 n=1 Tax=Dreissena polymorpha TaxID=45954 RepID=UPI002264DE8E|nr:C-type lectin lectoxin-Phi2-like isoform X2 [Dreissena polymorpha]